MDVTVRRLKWLAAGLGLALVVVVVDYVKYADAKGETIRGLRSDAARTWLRDDLVGRHLFVADGPVFAGPGGDSVRVVPDGTGLLLWVVDPGRCVACFRELAATRQLAGRGDLRTVVVLSGPSAGKAASRAAAAGEVALDPSGRLLASLTDGRLAGAALYVDPGGVVLAAEGFDDRTTCDWSFTADVGALLGHTESKRVRRNRREIVPSLARNSSSRREDP